MFIADTGNVAGAIKKSLVHTESETGNFVWGFILLWDGGDASHVVRYTRCLDVQLHFFVIVSERRIQIVIRNVYS